MLFIFVLFDKVAN